MQKVNAKQAVELAKLGATVEFRYPTWLYCASALVGRYVYVTGKFGDHRVLGKQYTVVGILDTVTRAWRWVQGRGPANTLASMVLWEDCLYWIGEHDWLGHGSQQLSKFDLVLEEWTECGFKGRSPGMLMGCSMHLVERRKQLLIFGGRIDGVKQSKVHLLDMRMKSWVDVVVKGIPPAARWKHGSWMIGDVFYCAGGWDYHGAFASSKNVSVMHFGSGNTVTWSTLKTNVAIWDLASFTAIPVKDSVLLLGGVKDLRDNSVIRYDMRSGKFEDVELKGRSKQHAHGLLEKAQAGLEVNSRIILFNNEAPKGYIKVTPEW